MTGLVYIAAIVPDDGQLTSILFDIQVTKRLCSYIPDQIDLIFGEAEGFPGIRNPNIKDWIVKHQVAATYFYSAFPNASVRDVWKALIIKGGLDVVLDASSS